MNSAVSLRFLHIQITLELTTPGYFEASTSLHMTCNVCHPNSLQELLAVVHDS